mmetsp:Transcript_139189/g.388368  ORF Transcript_139189/g.388368 Transcript_139189/m.388368 type:complete len:209 (-) Transcript_139189:15-641(-)
MGRVGFSATSWTQRILTMGAGFRQTPSASWTSLRTRAMPGRRRPGRRRRGRSVAVGLLLRRAPPATRRSLRCVATRGRLPPRRRQRGARSRRGCRPHRQRRERTPGMRPRPLPCQRRLWRTSGSRLWRASGSGYRSSRCRSMRPALRSGAGRWARCRWKSSRRNGRTSPRRSRSSRWNGDGLQRLSGDSWEVGSHAGTLPLAMTPCRS